MGKFGDNSGRDSRDQRAGEKSDKYLKLSLSGKWIALASLWLQDNCPCLVSDYYLEVSKLMPMHVEPFRKRRDVKMSLAKSALSRLCRPEKGYEALFSTDGIWILPNRIANKKKRCKYDYEDMERQMRNGTVDVSTIENFAQRKAAISYLASKGFKRVAKNIYVRIDECIPPTS